MLFFSHVRIRRTKVFLFIYRNPDARETEKRLVPDNFPYNDDGKIPLFSWSSQRLSDEEFVTIS